MGLAECLIYLFCICVCMCKPIGVCLFIFCVPFLKKEKKQVYIVLLQHVSIAQPAA